MWLIIDSSDKRIRLRSLIGTVAFLFICFLASANPSRVSSEFGNCFYLRLDKMASGHWWHCFAIHCRNFGPALECWQRGYQVYFTQCKFCSWNIIYFHFRLLFFLTTQKLDLIKFMASSIICQRFVDSALHSFLQACKLLSISDQSSPFYTTMELFKLFYPKSLGSCKRQLGRQPLKV